ncbi:hypothetical protein PY365_09055 [Roseiarcaceae bacterium H3SJ34-1]|uniref:hypothetical protein n=1 Tax=Terripilifer ovatus TaxID=3032367 RepID=UPI003AB93D45|nr:hypothetical protein [Roseiarcaceae bacterium H3SJ34-1]
MSTFEDGFIAGWQLVAGREAAIGIPRKKPPHAGYSEGYILGFKQALDVAAEQLDRQSRGRRKHWIERLFAE